jgi:hypothetical protein
MPHPIGRGCPSIPPCFGHTLLAAFARELHAYLSHATAEPEGFFSGPFLSVAVPRARETAFEALRGSWVEIRGHFSDPAAEACKITEGSPPEAPTAEQAIEICRTAFVVTGSQPEPVPSPTR